MPTEEQPMGWWAVCSVGYDWPYVGLVKLGQMANSPWVSGVLLDMTDHM
jgi:hypothetical protein